MTEHAFPTLQLIEGEFVPAAEICLVHAEKTFMERQENGDTNPLIVQMIHMGRLIDHWYYRSDQWVDQPYFKPSEFLQPHVGPADQAIPGLYGDETFQIDEEMTAMMTRKHCK